MDLKTDNEELYSSLMLTTLDSHGDSNKWNNSLYGKIKRISNTKVGSVGQDFLEKICVLFNIPHGFPTDKNGNRLSQSPWDIEILGVKFELKTASEDVSGCFQFNHIRYHRPYDAVICLGIAPNDIYYRIWTKAEIATGQAGNLVSMERSGNASYKLTKRPTDLYNIIEFKDEIFELVQSQRFAHI